MTPEQARRLLALHDANVQAATRFALGTGTAKAQVDAAAAFAAYVNTLTQP